MTLQRQLTIVLFFLLALATNPIALAVLIDQNLDLAVLDGTSMEPTASTGDIYVGERLTYRFLDPHRGDIVSLRQPGEDGTLLLKRIIAVPGDTIEIFEGVVYLNGERLEEGYIHGRWGGTMGQVTLGAGEYFVMGDNRDVSLDSRRFGPITRDAIVSHGIGQAFPLGKASLVAMTLFATRVSGVILVSAVACWAVVQLAVERRRSAGWGVAGFLFGTLGWWFAYTFLTERPKEAVAVSVEAPPPF